jgi:hypothetical protein
MRNNEALGSLVPDYKSPGANNELRQITGALIHTPQAQMPLMLEAFGPQLSKVHPQIQPYLTSILRMPGSDSIDGLAKNMIAVSEAQHNTTEVGAADFLHDLNKYTIGKIRGSLHKYAEAQFEANEVARAKAGQPILGAVKAASKEAEGFDVWEGPILHYIHDNPSFTLKKAAQNAQNTQ